MRQCQALHLPELRLHQDEVEGPEPHDKRGQPVQDKAELAAGEEARGLHDKEDDDGGLGLRDICSRQSRTMPTLGTVNGEVTKYGPPCGPYQNQEQLGHVRHGQEPVGVTQAEEKSDDGGGRRYP